MRAFRDDVRAQVVQQGRDGRWLQGADGGDAVHWRQRSRSPGANAIGTTRWPGPELGLVTLASQLNVDLSPFPLSATLAEIAQSPLIHPAAAEKLLMQGADTTLEQLGRIFASSVRVPQLVGTGEQIADQLAELFLGEGCDGFVISPGYLPGSFSEFVESVIPICNAKGCSVVLMKARHYVSIWGSAT